MQPGQSDPKERAIQTIMNNRESGACYLRRASNPYEIPYLLVVEVGSKADKDAQARCKNWQWVFLGVFEKGARVKLDLSAEEILRLEG